MSYKKGYERGPKDVPWDWPSIQYMIDIESRVDIQSCIYNETEKIAVGVVFNVLAWRREWSFYWRICSPFLPVACIVALLRQLFELGYEGLAEGVVGQKSIEEGRTTYLKEKTCSYFCTK